MKKIFYNNQAQKIVLGIIILFVFAALNFARAEALAIKLSGRILLQVEDNGEAWYVNPGDHKRYYMGRPVQAFGLMRHFGVGITNNDLAKIQIANANFVGQDSDNDGLSDSLEIAIGSNLNNQDSDGDGFNDKDELLAGYNWQGNNKLNFDNDFARKQAGKIFLQVETNGEAWYVNPVDNKRYYLGRPHDAFRVMRELGLGITNDNLGKIEIGELPAGAIPEQIGLTKESLSFIREYQQLLNSEQLDARLLAQYVNIPFEDQQAFSMLKNWDDDNVFAIIKNETKEDLLEKITDKSIVNKINDNNIEVYEDRLKKIIMVRDAESLRTYRVYARNINDDWKVLDIAECVNYQEFRQNKNDFFREPVKCFDDLEQELMRLNAFGIDNTSKSRRGIGF